MRTMLLSLAGAVSALAIASPAAAQWAPQPYGYGSPGYGYSGYGGYGGYGIAASLQQRIARIRGEIVSLDRQGRLSQGQARRLFGESRALDSRVREETYEGDGRELREVAERVERLEQRVRYASNRYVYGGYNNSYGYNGYGAYNGYQGRGDRGDDRWGGDRDDDGD